MQWSEKQRKIDERTENWVEKQSANLSKAQNVIAEIHDISTRRKDFLLIVIVMGVAISITTSSFLDVLSGPPSSGVIVALLIGLWAIVGSYYVFNWLNTPPIFPAQLDAHLSHEDLMFYASYDSNRIRKFMDEGEGINDFQTFARNFLTGLSSLCVMMFGVAETRKEIVADTDMSKVDPDYPPWHLILYLPDFIFRKKTIRNAARFRISPDVYEVAGQKAVRRLNVTFSLNVLNPEHPYADEFLSIFYDLRLSGIPRRIGLALSAQFNSLMGQVESRQNVGN